MQCKNKRCRAQGNIAMEAGHGRPFTEADNEARRFVPLMRFRCMGFQPLDFIFGTDWVGMMTNGVEVAMSENILIPFNGHAANVFDMEATFQLMEE
ncbi:putative F-box protein At1g49610 [Fagus crenata]